ncbi:MAG: hypothetical protein KGI38_04250 [Thaumarchaeota archaeon]|nr:hypothetical protein [Nitrososphaerota archaeon]
MKRSRLLAVSVVALMVLAALPGQVAQAQGTYTEKLNVYVAGSDALWYFTFGGVNSSSHLSPLESVPGLSWYNVTAIDTRGWQSDFQVFGPKGYNLLPVPFVPPEGMFLTVGSDSFADASAAAAAIDPYLSTNFVSLTNGTGTYSFYSSLSFSDLVPVTLLHNFLPTGEGGFASAIPTSSFSTTSSPFVVLEGVKSASGFTHNLVVGSISASALGSSGNPTFLNYFGSGLTSLRASNHSSSSVIKFSFLDGIVVSTKDGATVTSNSAAFTGSYTLSLAAGHHVTKINATVVEQKAPLLATRAVDVGVLRANSTLAVTLTLRNLSPTYTITKITFSDDWWSQGTAFKLLGGSDTVPTTSLSAGASITPVYRLQYTGTSTGSVTIPASVVRYQYQADGVTFNATAVLNPIRLSLGADDAVVYAYLTPDGNLGEPVGSPQKLNVTVVNVGTLPASSVIIAGQSIPGLAAKTASSAGGTATVTVSQSAMGLIGINLTKDFAVTYQDPAGSTLNATTNKLSSVFFHTSMNIGNPALTVGVATTALPSLENNLNISFSVTNNGPRNVTSFKASGTLPSGLGCGTTAGKGITCSGGVVTISYRVLNASSLVTTYMAYNPTKLASYVIAPLDFEGVTAGLNVTGRSNAAAAPSGLLLSKSFSPSALFGGMRSTVTVAAFNAGPLPFYNATLKSTVDSFDSLSNATSLVKGPTPIAPNGNSTFSYGVVMSQGAGVLHGTPATATFFFGGTSFSFHGAEPKVEVYQPLSVTITTNPATPEEGKNFTVWFKITNPSSVTVSDVLFRLPVPTGLSLSALQNLQVSGGTLIITESSLGPNSSATASASAVASSGITVPFDGAKLTFTYAGATVVGTVPSKSGIAIAEDVTTRYLIPTAFVILALLATAFYVRRKAAAATVPSSPK